MGEKLTTLVLNIYEQITKLDKKSMGHLGDVGWLSKLNVGNEDLH